jgi:hypothetical protein
MTAERLGSSPTTGKTRSGDDSEERWTPYPPAAPSTPLNIAATWRRCARTTTDPAGSGLPATTRQPRTRRSPALSPPATSTAVLLSDGASRLADRFQLATWDQLVKLLATDGPDALIDRVREAERSDPDGQRWPRASPATMQPPPTPSLCRVDLLWIKARRKRRAARRGACGLRPVPALAPQPDERAPWFRASRTQGYRGRCGHTARQRSAAGKPHEVQVARAVALTKSGVEIDVVAVGVAHGRDPMSPWRVERLMGAA